MNGRSPRTGHIRAGSLVVALCTALAILCLPPQSAWARSPLRPQVFALPLAAFPAGSRIVRATIESNRRLVRDDPTHFGPSPGSLGRRTGYYMDAEEQTPAGAVTGYTSYLVSIFSSPKQAQAAYEIRWSTWFDATYYTTPAPVPVPVGDTGDEALFHSFAPHPALAELFFRRDAILVEVFQGRAQGSPSAAESRSFLEIATKLDGLVRLYSHRLSNH